jgi:hypothetical protein
LKISGRESIQCPFNEQIIRFPFEFVIDLFLTVSYEHLRGRQRGARRFFGLDELSDFLFPGF